MAVGGTGGDDGESKPLPPDPPKVGGKRRRDFDPYEIAVAEPFDDDVPARVDPCAPSPTLAETADSHAQLQWNIPENSDEAARGSGEAASTGNRFVC